MWLARVNAEKTKYGMFMSYQHNSAQHNNIKQLT
jgi:hypothetical protein